jgi:hypothetical protein
LHVRQKSYLPGRLDSYLDVTLVLCAVTGDPTGADLSALAHEPPEEVDIFVVDPLRALLAKNADLLLSAGASFLGSTLGVAVSIIRTCHRC